MKTIIKNIIQINIVCENEHKDDTELDKDYMTQCIGSFGVWQAIFSTIAASARIIALWNMLAITFLIPPTNFTCTVFGRNMTEEIEESTCYEACIEYKYSSNVFDETLISKFNLICESAWLANFTQTTVMFGVLLGTSLYGWVSDRFGRRLAYRLSTFTNIIFTLAAPFSPNYWTLNILRFFIGMSSGGIIIVSSIYIIELMGSKHREVAGCIALMPDGIAQATLPIFAYFSSTWDTFMIEYWILCSVVLILVLLLPESPRWLVSNGKVDKAIELLTSAADRNKLSTENIKEIITKNIENVKIVNGETKTWNYIDLFRTKDMVIRIFCMFVIFTASGALYFGISQFLPNIGFNIYVDVALMGLIQVPINLSSIVINKIIGRKMAIVLPYIISSISMAVLIFIPSGHWACTIAGVIVICASTISFVAISIYIPELFPTPLRSMAFSFTGIGSSLGAMATPFIVSLTPQWIPALILAVIPLAASLFCIMLPETKGQDLIDTVN